MRPLEHADPRRIGPYRLLGRLGAGGIGVVYLGRSYGGRTVVVRLVRAELAHDAGFRARFRAEVAAARAASGAFTAPVIDADPDAVTPWLATVFVPGVSLHEAVRLDGPLPRASLLALAAGVAEALAGIHAAGLVHRDLKPGNVLLALDGPHLIDFGIARAADGTRLTGPGLVLGTTAYMAPEQATGRVPGQATGRAPGQPTGQAPGQAAGEAPGQPLTPACDMFSLGATLAFAASGSSVFGEGLGPDVRRRVVGGEPDLSTVPDELRPLVAACLAKSPADRPTPRQAIEFLPRGVPSTAAGAWLPASLITAIERVAAVMVPSGPSTEPAEPLSVQAPSSPAAERPGAAPAHAIAVPPPPLPLTPPRPLPLPSSPGSVAAPGPSRRRVVLGLTGGALAGGGTMLALALRGRPSDGASGNGEDRKPRRSPDPKDPGRVLTTKTAATPLWTAEIDERLLHVVGADETVIAVGTKNLRAFDRDGKPRWDPLRNTTSAAVADMGGNPVVLGDGMAFAVDHTDQLKPTGRTLILRAVDLATGTEKWALDRPADGVMIAGAHAKPDGLVYVTGSSYSRTAFVWAVDPATRKIRWTKEFDNVAGQFLLMVPSSGEQLLWRSSTRVDQSAPRMSALDAESGGEALWQQPVPGSGNTLTMVIDSLRVRWSDGPHCSAGGFFLHLAGRLYAVDPTNGQVAWSSPDSLPVTAVTASPDGETVYDARVVDKSGVLVRAFNALTGAVRWAGTLPEAVEEPVGLQCADGNLYVGSIGRVRALDAESGTARWNYDFAASTDALWTTYVPMWAGGGRLYAGSDKGLIALDAEGG
ncbi:serine/threonine-protein kinase [Streptomyces sp. NPDC102274]|uniref:serine/threonine-protein kinase n=1 Tax=Streptomyces sp. NPDC102274 TaxID=3366151 RepID=UPI00380B9771